MDNSANTLDELLTAEHAGWASLCDGTAGTFYGQIMTPDAVMVLANGGVMDRDTVVSALAQSPPWARYAIENPQLITIGADTAAVVYRGTAWRVGEDQPFVGAMSSVYVRRADGWKLALYQQTPVTE